MTDTKPTLEEAAHQDWCRWWNHGDMCSCGAVSAIRSAELPVEPEIIKLWADGPTVPQQQIIDYIDALKAYAQKRDAELAAMYKAAEEHAGHELGLWPLGAVAAVGRLESRYAALRARLMEPDDEMMEVYRAAFISEKRFDGREVFKAMSAVALKEGK